MARVGLLLKRDKPEAVELARELGPWLKERVEDVVVAERAGVSGPVPGLPTVAEPELADRIDLLLVLGGDGTLLHAASLVADKGVPILGINLGHLGFLTSCAPENARPTIERALAGELAREERLRLRCEVFRADGPRSEVHLVRTACNDVVVSQGALARLIELEAWQVRGAAGQAPHPPQPADRTLINRYRSDGLIVATPTGSTAYNLAAGGPIVTPDVQAMVVTPICPHALTNRPVVAPVTSRIQIRLGQPADDVMVTVDGQWGTRLGWNDVLEVAASPTPLRLFRPIESYFDVLRTKLHWGEREG